MFASSSRNLVHAQPFGRLLQAAACVLLWGLLEAGLAGYADAATPDSGTVDSLEVQEFNRGVDRAAPTDAWTRSPILVVLEFMGLESTLHLDTRFTAIEVLGSSERHDRVAVVVTLDGLADDSVRGSRYWFELYSDPQGRWRMEAAVRAWRCWPGRGHDAYSTTPCL